MTQKKTLKYRLRVVLYVIITFISYTFLMIYISSKYHIPPDYKYYSSLIKTKDFVQIQGTLEKIYLENVPYLGERFCVKINEYPFLFRTVWINRNNEIFFKEDIFKQSVSGDSVSFWVKKTRLEDIQSQDFGDKSIRFFFEQRRTLLIYDDFKIEDKYFYSSCLVFLKLDTEDNYRYGIPCFDTRANGEDSLWNGRDYQGITIYGFIFVVIYGVIFLPIGWIIKII